MRFWIAPALLALSWLFGLHVYAPARPAPWMLAVVLATVCLIRIPIRLPRTGESLLAAVLLVPGVWHAPWPYRAGPLLMGIGLLAHGIWPGRRRPDALFQAALAAGLILLVQAVFLEGYFELTARSHELPWPLNNLLAIVARLAGNSAALDGTTVVIETLRGPLRLGATWELLVDPATLLFVVGGLVLSGIEAGMRSCDNGSGQQRPAAWARSALALACATVAWLPLRAGTAMALLIHRVVRWEDPERFNPMGLLFSPWLHAILLVPLVLVVGCSIQRRATSAGPCSWEDTSPEPSTSWTWRGAASWVFGATAMALAAWVVQWDPVGRRLEGRVTVVERHSTWEPTTRPYDTQKFGEDSSYTYAALYDYCDRYYQMGRLLESEAIDDSRLSACDVLVIKTPTARYEPAELDAIRRFVERGGGLLLIGEHTDVFKTSTFLNDIARRFGFAFRLDLLFCIGDPYVQWYEPPRTPHPIVQHVPRMNFAVSCSIDPGWSLGRAAVFSHGLWSLPPEYHTENFFPEAEYRPEMRYGAFIQLWTTRYGAGRVAAWTDSTIFSNFSVFEPGKTELFLGMIEWLNRRSVLDRLGWRMVLDVLLVGAALGAAVGAWRLGQQGSGAWWVLLAAGVCGWVGGSAAVAATQRAAMPPPEPLRPMTRVVVDRTVSEVPLGRGGFTQEDGLGYGLLEQWIPRLGYFTARRSGRSAFEGDVLLVIAPTKSVPDAFREQLVEYVAAGGKLLVIDSPDVVGSTANSLLWPFGLAINHATSGKGKLGLANGWPGIALQSVCEVTGGEPFMWAGGLPVAARTSYGSGRVMAIGFGSVMNDEGLGGHWMADPEPDMLLRSDLWFALLRALVEDQPATAPPPREPEPKPPKSAASQTAP